jgi:hypothetical protein
MAKSEIHAIYVWHAVENLVCQHAGRRENDFAISIKSDEDPNSFTSVRSDVNPTQWYWRNFELQTYRFTRNGPTCSCSIGVCPMSDIFRR